MIIGGNQGADQLQGQPALGRLAECRHRLRSAICEPLLTVLFPPRCAGCGDFETYLCDECRQHLVDSGTDFCPRCGEPGPQALAGGRCDRCMAEDLEYAGAKGAFCHEGVAKDLVSQLKFGGQPVLGRLMAELAKPAFDEFIAAAGPRERLLLTWVPCHPSTRRERGYNQAEILARWLDPGRPARGRTALVHKRRPTKEQKTLGKAGRRRNLSGVFELDASAVERIDPRIQAIILVDDVFTTGATAGEVSAVLRKGTALPVHVFTFSRVSAGSTERHD